MITLRGWEKIKQYKKQFIYLDTYNSAGQYRVINSKKSTCLGEFHSLREAEMFCENLPNLQSFVDEIKINYKKNKVEISSLIENNRLGVTANNERTKENICRLLKFNTDFIVRSTFESCSFVMALADLKTVVEICFYPEMITIEESEKNPLFQYMLV